MDVRGNRPVGAPGEKFLVLGGLALAERPPARVGDEDLHRLGGRGIQVGQRSCGQSTGGRRVCPDRPAQKTRHVMSTRPPGSTG